MRGLFRVTTIFLSASAIVFVFLSCSSHSDNSADKAAMKEQQTQTTKSSVSAAPAKPSSPIIQYSILRQWRIPTSHTPAGGRGMEILVSATSTKEEVLQLATALRSQYAVNDQFLQVDIFDDENAYRNRDNMSYPESEYFKHFLVFMVVNPNTGANELNWTAKGRDH